MTTRVRLENQIFVSRSLNLNSIQLVGFDMDYTLIQYKEEVMEREVFDESITYLMNKMNYPESIKKFEYKHGRFIRGLVIDTLLGNVIKINSFGYVKAARHGENFYSREELRNRYSNEIVKVGNHRYEMVDTMFSLALCSLYCQLVEQNPHETNYQEIFIHTKEAVDYCHREGALKPRIIKNPSKYVSEDPEAARTLKLLKKFGKKVILITNSGWEFTDAMMTHAFGPHMQKGQNWRDLFDLIIVAATKPLFFNPKNRFFEIMPETGLLQNVNSNLEEGKIYQGGSADRIEELFKLNPSQILYVGDHIYSDVYHSKKYSQWRTMLIITELSTELAAARQAEPILEKIRVSMIQKEDLELELDRVKVAAIENDINKSGESPIREKIRTLDQTIGKLIEKYNSYFNKEWGEVLWAGNDKSQFLADIERYACTYTSLVGNMAQYSPTHYFRPKIKSYFQ